MSCSALVAPGRIGLGDAQDRVVAVAVRTGLLIVAGLIEKRVDLLSEGREAQEPGPAQLDVGDHGGRVDTVCCEQAERTRFEGRVGGERLDPPGEGRTFSQLPSSEPARSRFSSTTLSASSRTWASGSTRSRFRCSRASGRLQKPVLVGAQREALPAQGGVSSASAESKSVVAARPDQSARQAADARAASARARPETNPSRPGAAR